MAAAPANTFLITLEEELPFPNVGVLTQQGIQLWLLVLFLSANGEV